MIEIIHQWIVAILLVSGSVFVFIAGLGIMRLPDLFTRMHAATKASSFGVGQIALAVGLYFLEPWIALKCLLIIVFIFLTVPVGAHMLGRAAYFLRISMWPGTIVDELKNKYDLESHTLRGGDTPRKPPEPGKGVGGSES